MLSLVPKDACLVLERAYLAQHPDAHLALDGYCTVTQGTTYVSPPVYKGNDPCQGYWISNNLNAWGYIQVGYTQVAMGVCYYGAGYVPYLYWGPVCNIYFWPPNMRGWPYKCGTYYGNGGLTAYGGFQGQLWEPLIGWCCDRYWWEQYTVDTYGNWWYS